MSLIAAELLAPLRPVGVLGEHVGEVDLAKLARREERVDTLEEARVVL